MVESDDSKMNILQLPVCHVYACLWTRHNEHDQNSKHLHILTNKLLISVWLCSSVQSEKDYPAKAKYHCHIFKLLNPFFIQKVSQYTSPKRVCLENDCMQWKRDQHQRVGEQCIVKLTNESPKVHPVSLVRWVVFKRIFVDKKEK